MNDQMAMRLIDTLRTTNLTLARIEETLRQRQPYKPLLIVLPAGNINQQQFAEFGERLKDYFETIDWKKVE